MSWKPITKSTGTAKAIDPGTVICLGTNFKIQDDRFSGISYNPVVTGTIRRRN
ncbi:hypothetical protein SH668x_003629 [Planctomicrobium sp. SH668]|uniref:hypothetical protein n=1 Tax=Planctomicrobium sp. SH668 TaxID=3448126 RepID=UPI003F5B7C67